MEPISINLERWFDVDALITGLEAKRRSLRSSIEELKTIVQVCGVCVGGVDVCVWGGLLCEKGCREVWRGAHVAQWIYHNIMMMIIMIISDNKNKKNKKNYCNNTSIPSLFLQ